jgi:hypothetical protein
MKEETSDVKEGRGILVKQNGVIIIGEFKDDHPDGQVRKLILDPNFD